MSEDKNDNVQSGNKNNGEWVKFEKGGVNSRPPEASRPPTPPPPVKKE